jgi:hypothetical protein
MAARLCWVYTYSVGQRFLDNGMQDAAISRCLRREYGLIGRGERIVHGSHGAGLMSNAQQSPFCRDAALCPPTSRDCGQKAWDAMIANKRIGWKPAVESYAILRCSDERVVALVREHAFAD